MRFFLLLLLHLPVWADVSLFLEHDAAVLPAVDGRPTFAPGTLVRVRFDYDFPDNGPTINPATVRLQVRTSSGTIESGPIVVDELPPIPIGLTVARVRLPQSLPTGDAEVIAISAAREVRPLPIRVVASRPALYPATSGYSGDGIALSYVTEPGRRPLRGGLARPLHPGQFLSVWTTGLGNAGVTDVALRIGGRRYPAAYAGAAPDSPGVDQINVWIPAGTSDWPENCYTPIAVESGQTASNVRLLATMREASACVHPLGLSLSEMEQLDAGKQVRAGFFSLNSTITLPATASDTLEDHVFRRWEAARATFPLQSADQWRALALEATKDLSPGCSIIPRPTIFLIPDLFSDGDAGELIHLTAPNFRADLTGLLFRLGVGISSPLLGYSAELSNQSATDPTSFSSAKMEPGIWRVESSGGRNVGPFSFELSVPPPVRWLNANSLRVVDRSKGTTVIWNPSGYGANDWAEVRVYRASGDSTGSGVTGVTCSVRAAEGVAMVPAELLRQMGPVSSSNGLPGAVLEITITRRAKPQDWFPLPAPPGKGGRSGLGVFQYRDVDLRLVELR